MSKEDLLAVLMRVYEEGKGVLPGRLLEDIEYCLSEEELV